MRYHKHFLGLLLAISIPAFAKAQDVANGGEAEHRYQFDVPPSLSAYTEKLFVEAMTGFDPNMKINVDRPTRIMKVLAYRPLDPDAVIHLAAQFGVAITERRSHATRNIENQ